MPGVLLVDADPSRAAVNRTALTAVGYAITVVASGAVALTMLERARPDVVVSGLQVEDMYAYELCAIIRSDPMTREIPFLLLTDRRSTPESLVRAIAELPAATEAPPASAHPATGADDQGLEPLSSSCPATGPATASDAPEATELEEVFRAVTEGKKTGRLVACVGAAEGVLLFKAGRLVNAEFQGQRGELAVTTLLVAATSGSAGRYRFLPWDGSEVPKRAWTIDHDAEGLLLRTYA